MEVKPVHPKLGTEEYTEDYAYLVHGHCWDFLERVVGCTIRSELSPLVHVLRARWDDEGYGGAKQFRHIQWQGGRNERKSTVMFVTDPVDVPEVRSLITRWTDLEIRGVKVNEYNHPLQRLPMELKLMLLDLLDYCDVQCTLCGLGWQAPAQYWKSRFRSELFFEIDSIPLQQVDWYSLWFSSEHLLHHYPPLGLANRWRILKIVKAVTLEFNSYRRLHQAGGSLTRTNQWNVTYRSPRVNDLFNTAQAVCLPAIVYKVCFSFTNAGEGDGRLLCGIEFLPEGSALGHCLPEAALPPSAIFSVCSRLIGLMVRLDQKGIRDIKPICKDSQSRWIVGYSEENTSVGLLFNDEDYTGIQICAMIDVRSLSSKK